MEKTLSFLKTRPFAISAVFITAVFLLRFAIGSFDPSYFILAEENFVVKEELTQKIKVVKSGYDGQFFYRYALNPFSKDIEYTDEKIEPLVRYGNYGIMIDNPKYRRARVIYPLASWLLAFGSSSLVPYTLIIVNILAYILICFICLKVVEHYQAPIYYSYFPLLVGGLYFSTARDLSDTLSCALLALCYHQYIKNNTGWFLIMSTLALLCREALAFFLFPAFVILFFKNINTGYGTRRIKDVALLFAPWAVYFIWNKLISSLYPDITVITGQTLNVVFGLPFVGLYNGLVNDPSVYWYIIPYKLFFLVWTMILYALCIQIVRNNKDGISTDWMYWAFIISVFLTITYSHRIYIDTWSFLRVLAPSQLLCFFFLIKNKFQFPVWFGIYGIGIMLLAISTILKAI